MRSETHFFDSSCNFLVSYVENVRANDSDILENALPSPILENVFRHLCRLHPSYARPMEAKSVFLMNDGFFFKS